MRRACPACPSLTSPAPAPDRSPGSGSCPVGLVLLLVAAVTAGGARADEGMWTFNAFPVDRVAEKYGFTPSAAWLDHLRLASVRFDNGGSGSFVSPDGLVITNHHVGADCIQQLSTPEHDYYSEGFIAAQRSDEARCPNLELNLLVGIERVTDRIRGAERRAGDGQAEDAAGRERAADAAVREAKAAIEKECAEKTGMRCEVVTLYAGGEYDLYRYRRYTDVRLVFAPEAQLAFFGGDPDNFNFPRYGIDFALFRVYQDDRPLHVDDYLRWSARGPQEEAVALVSGNPGSTSRLDTVAQLKWLRDGYYPFFQLYFVRQRNLLAQFAARGAEQARVALDDSRSIDNSIKAISGYLSGLLAPDLMARKTEEEQTLRRRLAANPAFAARLGDPWREIAEALDAFRAIYPRYRTLESALPRAGQLSELARKIVRLAGEKRKPNGERLRDYRDSRLPSLLQDIESPAPIYPEYEQFGLEHALELVESQLGPVHPLVVEAFAGKTAAAVAAAAIGGTRVGDLAFRRSLVAGGWPAVEASDDPLIRLMRVFEPAAVALEEQEENEVEATQNRAGARIAELFFDVHGSTTYPDATFTLRLSYGKVTGFEEGGKPVRWYTDFGGLFRHSAEHGGTPPYDLAPALAAARERLDPSLPVDFLTTNDIIGGNSGSPVVDRDGDFVGIVFDGNLYMLPNRFVYSDVRSRTIAVDSRALLATLRVIYPRAATLADELTGK